MGPILSGCDIASEEVSHVKQALTPSSLRVVIEQGTDLRAVAISTTSELILNSRSSVCEPSASCAVLNSGTGNTYLQAGGQVFGALSSVGPVQLDTKTRIDGNLLFQTSLSKQGVGTVDQPTITGTELQGPVSTEIIEWPISWPESSSGDVILNAVPTRQDTTLVPGRYGRASVHARNHIYLSSGEYFFDELQTEPEAHVHINSLNGPVMIWIRNRLSYRGKIETGSEAKTLIGYLGSNDVIVQAPLAGTIVAPYSQVRLEALPNDQHRGAVFSKNLSFASGYSAFKHIPFDSWGVLGILGPDGGTLYSEDGRASLHVPQGALTKTIVARIEPLNVSGRFPYSGLLDGEVFELSPHGTQFLKPAILSLKIGISSLKESITGENLAILQNTKKTSTIVATDPWTESAATYDPNSQLLTGKIKHFSPAGGGIKVDEIRLNPDSLALIPNTARSIIPQLFGNGQRLLHATNWVSMSPSIATIQETNTLLEGTVRAGNQVGTTDIVLTVLDGSSAPLSKKLPVKVGLATLAISTESSSFERSDLNDRKTIALAASTHIDLPIAITEPASLRFDAYTYPGQEVYVYNFPGYGLQARDIGGSEFFGPYTNTYGWSFMNGLTYSRVVVPVGESRKVSYSHGTGHVVRYVRGTCSTRVSWNSIFENIHTQLAKAMYCNAPSSSELERRSFEAQPHFRGQTGLSELNKAPVEMGFFFSTDWRVNVFAGAGATIQMNPGYSFGLRSDGSVDVSLINDRTNVVVVNDRDGIKESTQESLRARVPKEIERLINRQLTKKLSGKYASRCSTDIGCYNSMMSNFENDCADGTSPGACVAASALGPENFVCQNSQCTARLQIQEINVLPTELEFVLAPNPSRSEGLLAEMFELLGPELGGICDPSSSTTTVRDQPVGGLQLGLAYSSYPIYDENTGERLQLPIFHDESGEFKAPDCN